MRARVRLVFLLSATLGLSACGGDTETTPRAPEQPAPPGTSAAAPTTAAPTKGQFIAEGDAVCRDFREATEDARSQRPSGYDQLAEQVAEIRRAAESAMERFRSLTPPPGDEEIVERYSASIEDSLAIFRRLEAAAKKQDTAKIKTYTDDLLELAKGQRELAQGYGFKVCGFAS